MPFLNESKHLRPLHKHLPNHRVNTPKIHRHSRILLSRIQLQNEHSRSVRKHQRRHPRGRHLRFEINRPPRKHHSLREKSPLHRLLRLRLPPRYLKLDHLSKQLWPKKQPHLMHFPKEKPRYLRRLKPHHLNEPRLVIRRGKD